MRLRLAALMLGGMLAAGAVQAAPVTPGEVMLRAAEAGPAGAQWRAYERVFPRETHALFAEMAVKLQRRYATAAQANQAAHAVTQELMARASALIIANMRYAASASDAQLQTYVAAQGALLQDLRARDIERCAAAVQNSSRVSDMGDPTIKRDLLANNIVLLGLIESGRDHPQTRSVTVQDMAGVVAQWSQAGMSQAELDIIQAGTLQAQPPQLRCDIGIAMMHALAATDPVKAGDFMSVVLGGLKSNGHLDATATLESLGDFGPILKRFEALYPQETAALMADYARDHAYNGESWGAALIQLIGRHVNEAVMAPDDALAALARYKADVLHAIIAASPQGCDQLRPSDEATKMKDGLAFFEQMSSVLTAAKASPIAHGPITPEDIRALRSGMTAAGVSAADADAALTAQKTPPSPAQACRASDALFSALAAAPPPVTGRVMATLLLKGMVFALPAAPAATPAPTPAKGG